MRERRRMLPRADKFRTVSFLANCRCNKKHDWKQIFALVFAYLSSSNFGAATNDDNEKREQYENSDDHQSWGSHSESQSKQ